MAKKDSKRDNDLFSELREKGVRKSAADQISRAAAGLDSGKKKATEAVGKAAADFRSLAGELERRLPVGEARKADARSTKATVSSAKRGTRATAGKAKAGGKDTASSAKKAASSTGRQAKRSTKTTASSAKSSATKTDRSAAAKKAAATRKRNAAKRSAAAKKAAQTRASNS